MYLKALAQTACASRTQSIEVFLISLVSLFSWLLMICLRFSRQGDSLVTRNSRRECSLVHHMAVFRIEAKWVDLAVKEGSWWSLICPLGESEKPFAPKVQIYSAGQLRLHLWTVCETGADELAPTAKRSFGEKSSGVNSVLAGIVGVRTSVIVGTEEIKIFLWEIVIRKTLISLQKLTSRNQLIGKRSENWSKGKLRSMMDEKPKTNGNGVQKLLLDLRERLRHLPRSMGKFIRNWIETLTFFTLINQRKKRILALFIDRGITHLRVYLPAQATTG